MFNRNNGQVTPFRSVMLSLFKVFARKVVGCLGGVQKSDIDNEERVISSLLTFGGHENIVSILDHGWFKFQFDFYFIDMELCDLSLRDYIDYLRGTKPTGDLTKNSFIPVFVERDCSLLLRMRNMWMIGAHIASGLEFMHANEHVHRDLKPGNGIIRYNSSIH